MLVLSRKPGERIELRIGSVTVLVEVCQLGREKVRLGFLAPPSVKIHRTELLAHRSSRWEEGGEA